MKRLLLAFTSLTASLAFQMPAQASSHREAPMIAGMPRLDASDFYFFRSYEPGRSAYVTMIADYVPLQDPGGGPNFYDMEHNGFYDINIDLNGSGRPTYIVRFRVYPVSRDLALSVGGKKVAIPLVNDGPISVADSSAQNVGEVYTISLIDRSKGTPVETLLKDTSGNTQFQKPVDRIGDKSVPNYAAYAASFTHDIVIPGCGVGRVFVGQRKDPFVVNLGETFDLVNYVHPAGEQYAASAQDDLAAKNVTSIVTEVPTACLTQSGDPVVGAWTTSSLGTTVNGHTTFEQVSRLANPLVNELVIGLKDKDKFNMSLPANDGQFAKYVTNPTVPALIEALYPTLKAPTKFPRADLVAVFLTGLANVNQPSHGVVPAEEMRLNTSTPITPYGAQNRLGVIGGDSAGYPNGRRPGDDVVDITLRVAMGRLYALGLYGTPADAPAGLVDLTDGAYTDDTHYLSAFPYVMPPLSDSHQPVHQ